MRAIPRDEIRPTKMAVNPPKEIVDCGFKVINNEDGHIYGYVGIGWVKEEKATDEDYLTIPKLMS